MNILLAEPPYLFLENQGRTSTVFPLGLGYLGAALAPHHPVSFFIPDMTAPKTDDPWAELEKLLVTGKWNMVGITATSATIHNAYKLAKRIKSIATDLFIVLGGSHATLAPAQALLDCREIDGVIAGEGETSIVRLADILVSGGYHLMSTVPGLTFRDDNGGVRSAVPSAQSPDLDSLAFPVREPILGCTEVHPAVYQSMITSRGCRYGCAYCSVPKLYQHRVRFRSIKNVLRELHHFQGQQNAPYVFFHDTVFTLNRKRTITLCRQMIQEDLTLPFACQTRIECLDVEMLAYMKKAGCHRILLGIESGGTETLKKIGKIPDLSLIRKAVKMVQSAGILCTGFFMVGFPWENEAKMTETLDFAIDLNLDSIHLFSVIPLPCTPLWKMAGLPAFRSGFDFNGPSYNLTSIPDDSYRCLFKSFTNRVNDYNARFQTAD